jgi:hypothetical protein
MCPFGDFGMPNSFGDEPGPHAEYSSNSESVDEPLGGGESGDGLSGSNIRPEARRRAALEEFNSRTLLIGQCRF